MKEKNKTRSEYSVVFERWLFDSTCDGVPSLVLSKRHLVHFIFWLLLFFTCIGLCGYMVVKMIIEYAQFEVTTKLRESAVGELQFPVVVICNENMLLTPQANQYIRDYFRVNNGINVTTYTDILDHFGVAQARNELQWLAYKTNDPKLNDSVRRSFGYAIEDMFFTVCT